MNESSAADLLTVTADKYVKMMTSAMWPIIFIPPAYPHLMSLLHRSLGLSPQIRSSLGSMVAFTLLKENVGKQRLDGEKNRSPGAFKIMKDLLLPLTV